MKKNFKGDMQSVFVRDLLHHNRNCLFPNEIYLIIF
jgi:hypothetical protein